jgi:hypothetical protein
MIGEPEKYCEWKRLRREWNKNAEMEIRHQYLITHIVDEYCKMKSLSAADFFAYNMLGNDLHSLN